jgi:hypothetical protein
MSPHATGFTAQADLVSLFVAAHELLRSERSSGGRQTLFYKQRSAADHDR